MRSLIRKYITVVAALMLLAGCANEYLENDPTDEATITLNLNLPYVDNGGTRSIESTPDVNGLGENRIETIDILALTQKDGQWVYDYTAEIVSKVQSGKDLTVTAWVRGMSTPQQFVILANSSSELAAAAPIRYEKITSIENRLVCSAGGGEWPAKNNGIGSFTPFPMYARTVAHTVNSNMAIGEYQMLRMVSRINVTLKSGIGNFILDDACLFNYKTAGFISYANSGFDGLKATVPAVPVSGDHPGEPIKGPTVFYKSSKTTDPRGMISSSIYTFESPAITNDAGRTKGTALVIGGYYNGETVKKSYYRIDFKTTSDFTSNISSGLLRNHSYEIEVQSVNGSGYETPEEAYNGSSKLTACVVPWNLTSQRVIADGQYWLTVSDDELLLRSGGSANFTAQTNYNITTQGYQAGIWVEPAEIEYTSGGSGWLTLSNVNNGNGSIERTIKVTATNNPSVTRTAKIFVKAGNLVKVVNVIVPQVTNKPVSAYTYVGAFWRTDHTGERLIRIKTTDTNTATGKWKVWVYDYGGDFNEGDIVFSTVGSSDAGIATGSPANMNLSDKDAQYSVNGNATSASGTINTTGDDIFFRIGLKTKWSQQSGYHSTNKPVRYAVIVLSYNNFAKHQMIWLRQGETEDYLIHPDDVPPSYKVYVQRFKPYNLTAMGMTEADYTNVFTYGGTWTDFPSQAGALFQWAGISGYERRAWHPSKIKVSGWKTSYNISTTWEAISATHETCPSGYRRPRNSVTIEKSEIARSLFTDIYRQDLYNSAWGYYADGFFDRYTIESSTSNIAYSAVNTSSNKVAYIGMLYYNNMEGSTRKNASLFFPAAGHRKGGDSELAISGHQGNYWTETPFGKDDALDMPFYKTATGILNNTNRGIGFPIRCVRRPPE